MDRGVMDMQDAALAGRSVGSTTELPARNGACEGVVVWLREPERQQQQQQQRRPQCSSSAAVRGGVGGAKTGLVWGRPACGVRGTIGGGSALFRFLQPPEVAEGSAAEAGERQGKTRRGREGNGRDAVCAR